MRSVLTKGKVVELSTALYTSATWLIGSSKAKVINPAQSVTWCKCLPYTLLPLREAQTTNAQYQDRCC